MKLSSVPFPQSLPRMATVREARQELRVLPVRA